MGDSRAGTGVLLRYVLFMKKVRQEDESCKVLFASFVVGCEFSSLTPLTRKMCIAVEDGEAESVNVDDVHAQVALMAEQGIPWTPDDLTACMEFMQSKVANEVLKALPEHVARVGPAVPWYKRSLSDLGMF